MMASEKNVNLLNENKKKWVVSLYGCFDYVSPITNKKRCCPLFCPISMICTPSIIGTIYSRLNNEDGGDYIPMGKDGCICCLINYGIAMTGTAFKIITHFFTILTISLKGHVVDLVSLE